MEKKQEGYLLGPARLGIFWLWEKARLVPTQVQAPLIRHFGCDKSKWWQLSRTMWRSGRGRSREQREGRGEEERGMRDKNVKKRTWALLWHAASGFRLLFTPPPSYGQQFISYNPWWYSQRSGIQIFCRPRVAGEWPQDREGTLGATVYPVARPPWSTLDKLGGCLSPRSQLLGDWHLLDPGEGPGSHWQDRRVHLHTLGSSSVATITKKDLLSSTTSLGMEYLSLQMMSLLRALDMVLPNMCNCWKCNDDYLHI